MHGLRVLAIPCWLYSPLFEEEKHTTPWSSKHCWSVRQAIVCHFQDENLCNFDSQISIDVSHSSRDLWCINPLFCCIHAIWLGHAQPDKRLVIVPQWCFVVSAEYLEDFNGHKDIYSALQQHIKERKTNDLCLKQWNFHQSQWCELD